MSPATFYFISHMGSRAYCTYLEGEGEGKERVMKQWAGSGGMWAPREMGWLASHQSLREE